MMFSWYPAIRTLFGSFGILLLAAGCMRSTPSLAPPTPTAPETVLTIDALLADPVRYSNTLLVVQGYFAGGIGRPECGGWVGAPTDWVLANTPSLQRVPGSLLLEVKNAFSDNALPMWAPGTYQKQIVLHGWLRQYIGPGGCGESDAQGNYTYDRADQKQVWYFEAVELQSEVPIEWYRPQDPTRQPHPRSTVTPNPTVTQ